MPDVWIISGKVHQQDPAVIVSIRLEIVVQLHFDPLPVVFDAFALLTCVVVIYYKGRDGGTKYFIAEHVVKSLISHCVARDISSLAALTD